MRIIKEAIQLPIESESLAGDLNLNVHARSMILMAQSSGSDRLSPHKRYLADALNRAGFTTLLLDLLTEREEFMERTTRHLRFNVDLLAERISAAIHWLERDSQTRNLQLGMLSTGTSTAAAFAAAVHLRQSKKSIDAIVSCNGRLELAQSWLASLKAPTLLLLGGNDFEIVSKHKLVYEQMSCVKKIMVLSGSDHILNETASIDEVARLSGAWFQQFLTPPPAFSSQPALIR